MNWYLEVLQKYAVFSGRARRKEYWFFALFNVLISVVLGFVDLAMGTISTTSGVGLLGGLYALCVLLPSLGVSVRRLHDTDRSGWWYWISLLPIVGGIVLFIFVLLASDEGDNKYGPNPHGSVAPPPPAV